MTTILRENSMLTVDEAAGLIRKGSRLLVSGDEKLLTALPHGDWIGGTTPYFMTEQGGTHTQAKVQVVKLPQQVAQVHIRLYAANELEKIPASYYDNGFSYLLIPAFTDAHSRFAKECSTWEGVFERPLVGWITGVQLEDIGKVKPKVVNGQTGEVSEESAAVMHIELAEGFHAEANIINLFRQGEGDTLTFPAAGFEVSECLVNGAPQNFGAYITESKIDTQLPLVADYLGAMINVSIQDVDQHSGQVKLYAPVFPSIEYKFARPVADYEGEFRRELAAQDADPAFTCNCILNYLYAKLEGKKTGSVVGPITFGEIAYMLLNQTLVYVQIVKG